MPQFCLRWRTPRMPASAFWYFDSRRQAMLAALQMQFGTRWAVYPESVR